VNDDKRLWAPWRLAYVTGKETGPDALPEPTAWVGGADRACFLCQAAATYEPSADADRRLLVAIRGTGVIVVLNRYPYNNGHLLIAPHRHVNDLCDMTRDEHLECIELFVKLTGIYREQMDADGFNIGLNLGRAAGAGLPGHLHWHLVPRWAGDTSFMPVLSDTRIIPQSLEALWEMLTSVGVRQ
jgi:ATP adenylyltransferase